MSVTQTRDAKLNQIVQNFFNKSLQVIAGARLPHSVLSPQQQFTSGGWSPKINRWFNLELEEIDRFKEELKLWRNADATTGAIPPLIVETCLDTRGLSSQQTPVLIDSQNKSWPATRSPKRTEVVLERWIIEFVPTAATSRNSADGPSPQDIPIIYKQAIVTLRSLYAYSRLLPCWTLRKKLSTSKLNVSSLKLDVRVLNGIQPISSRGRVGLTKDLTDSRDSHLESYAFQDIETPLGNLKISVTFRKNCDFRVSDSEKLLSSHFLSLDQVPSASQSSKNSVPAPTSNTSGGSLEPKVLDRPTGSRSSSSERFPIMQRRQSGNSTEADNKTAVSSPQIVMKPNVSFQPFNSPSLSASPNDAVSTSATSTGVPITTASPRTPTFSRGPSNSSVAALRIPSRSQQAAQANPLLARNSSEATFYSSIGSSAPTRDSSLPRYSSSFGSRGQWQRSGSRSSSQSRRLSFAESSSIDSSSSASVNPGSGLYVTSQDLGDFVKLVDSTAGVFNPGRRSSSSSINEEAAYVSNASPGAASAKYSTPSDGGSFRSNNPLSRFQQLRTSHNALSDSLQSSVYAAANKPETGSQPNSASVGKAIPSSVGSTGGTSVNSAHTPVIPSRLSEEVSASAVTDASVTNSTASDLKPKDIASVEANPMDITSPHRLGNAYRLRRKSSSTTSQRAESFDYYDSYEANQDVRHHSLETSPIDPLYSRGDARSVGNPSDLLKQRPRMRMSISGRHRYQDDDTAGNEEDDELLFAMSDMHLVKGNQSNAYSQWPSDDH